MKRFRFRKWTQHRLLHNNQMTCFLHLQLTQVEQDMTLIPSSPESPYIPLQLSQVHQEMKLISPGNPDFHNNRASQRLRRQLSQVHQDMKLDTQEGT